MSRKQESIDLIVKQGMLPLYFYPDETVSREVLKALYKAGVRTVEYTNRGATAYDNFKSLLQLRNAELPGMQLGIGTIKTADDAHRFIAAGADYIISPGWIPSVAAVVAQSGLLWVPGCMTTSEIIAAEHAGATLIKLFPGNLIGPSYVSAILDIFPELLFMPTGGVDLEEGNIRAWFQAGVCAVGMGSKLISKTLLEQHDYRSIASLTQKAFDIIRSVKGL